MDVQLLALIALIIVVVIGATRQHSRSWPGRPGWQYQRVFSVGLAGLLFLIAGVIGWDLSHSHGWFRGTTWVDAPVWWQIGLGSGLLLLATFWARRVPLPTASPGAKSLKR
jgi:hypothetical protein